MKIITATKGGIATEYYSSTLQEVLEVCEPGSDLSLDRWDENNVGHYFVDSAYIGNTTDNLSKEDYYTAYDKIF